MRLETLCIHASHVPDPATGAVTLPIHLSTTFERGEDGSYAGGHVYARDTNPTRAALEKTLAALEGGAEALAFASGQAATTAVLQALATGDHVVVPVDAYYGTPKLVRELFARWGLLASFVDMRDPAAVRAAFRPETRLVWIETPSNPLLAIADVAAIAEMARHVGARTVVDNTWATPLGQRPLDLGADLVMHSTTKYLGGHSDVLGGAIVARETDEFFERVKLVQRVGGAVAAPFDAWLVLRGIRSLPYRMRAHTEHATRLAEYLASHPAIERVLYPGHPSHPQFALARRQMTLAGGMLSVLVKGGSEETLRAKNRLRVFTRATSLGGVESLVEHRHSVEGAVTQAPPNLLRVSVGLEHPDDLVEDWKQALG